MRRKLEEVKGSEPGSRSITISDELAAKCDGPKQFERFDALVGKLLSVPRAKILERADDYAYNSANNPNRRGRKRKPLSSPGADVQPRA